MSFTRTGGRNAPSAHRLNRKSDFYDDRGMLKEGYSYTGGKGMVAMGEGKVGTTRGAGKDGMVGGTTNKIIYGSLPEQKQAPAQQTAPAVEPKPKDDLVIKQRGPIKHSSEIQEAKERVNKYQEGTGANSVYTPQKFQTEEPALNLDKYKFNARS